MSKRLIKNTSIYTLGHILPQAAAFILLPIYTRFLTPSDYGIVNSMEVLSAILIIFFTLAVDRSIYRLYFDYKTEKSKRDYLGTITISLSFISIFILLLLFIFRGYVEQIYKSIGFYPIYLYSILAVFLSVFSILPKIYFQVNEKAEKFIILSILQFLFSTGFVLYFIVVKRDGAVGMLLGRMLANLVILPLFLFISIKIINFKFQYKILKESLAFSLPMIPALLSAWILNLSDRIFIERYYTMADVGIYSLGYKIGGLLLLFSSAFNQAYSPVFYKLAKSKNQTDAKKKLYNYNLSYTLVLLFGAFCISFFSKELITLFLDPKYIEAYKIVPLIALSYFISQSSGLFDLSIYQEKKTLKMLYMILGSALLNIILNFLLVPPFGPYGAAYATVLSFAIFFMVKYWYSKRCYFIPFNWTQIIPFTGLLTFTVISFRYLLNIDIMVSLLIKMLLVAGTGAFFLKKYYPQMRAIFMSA